MSLDLRPSTEVALCCLDFNVKQIYFLGHVLEEQGSVGNVSVNANSGGNQL